MESKKFKVFVNTYNEEVEYIYTLPSDHELISSPVEESGWQVWYVEAEDRDDAKIMIEAILEEGELWLYG